MDEKEWEKNIEKLCSEYKISLEIKGIEKVKGLNDDIYFKSIYNQLLHFIKEDETTTTLKIKDKEIFILAEKDEYNYQLQGEKDYLNELKYDILQELALKRKSQATEMIVVHIKKYNHIFTTKDDLKSEMWIYKDGIYIPHGKSEIKIIMRKLIGEAFTTHLLNEVISKIEADTYIEQDVFFKNNYINEVPVLNGILNIKTRELKEFTPNKIFFNKLPITYNPELKCPKIINHFKTILKSEDDVPVMLELFGYLLYKEYKIEQAFMFVGNGRNGKSKTLELMKRFVGIENCASISLKAMNDESFDIWELFGKMVNLAGDLSKTDLKETGMFKMLVGRDTISARRKFLNVVKFVNYSKLIFSCNELPRVYDSSDGFWTKWVVLEFPYQFISKEVYDCLSDEEKVCKKIMDPDIINHISTPEEMSGLLNEGLDALDRLLKQKSFSYSQGTNEIKHFWRRKADSFASFCMDCLEDDYEYSIPKGIVRKIYSQYCKIHKVKGVSDKSIKATLEEEYGVSESRRTINGEFINCWDGIKINIRGINEIMGISTLYNISKFTIGSNMGDSPDTLDILNVNKLFKIRT